MKPAESAVAQVAFWLNVVMFAVNWMAAGWVATYHLWGRVAVHVVWALFAGTVALLLALKLDRKQP